MKIVRLPSGEHAPIEPDCISVFPSDDGRGFNLNSSVLAETEGSDVIESVALIDSPTYASRAEAEEAGLAWANKCGVHTLYVGDTPFSLE